MSGAKMGKPGGGTYLEMGEPEFVFGIKSIYQMSSREV